MVEVPELNLRHLLAVVAVLEAGSISAASPRVNLSQPALTQAVGRLEKQLQTALFTRHPDGMTPTEATRLLVPRVRRASGYIARGVQQARRAARLPSLPGVERRVTLSQLRALTEVADGGSYSLAAVRSGISQPAVYRAMSELAELVEVPLVQRRGKAVQLTAAATRMLRFARLARSELQAGLDELTALSSHGAGRVLLGTLPLARAVVLPRVLARFSRANPGATVNAVEGQYLELLGHLRDGSLDMIIGAMRQPAPVRDVVQEGLFDDEPVIVARSGHPLVGEPLDFKRLLDYPWVIAATGAPLRTRWQQMFLERGMEPPRLRIECGSVMVMRGLMLEDDWLTLMSRDQFLVERRAGLLRELGGAGASVRRRIALTTRGDWHPTRLQAHFVATLKAICKEHVDSAQWPFRYP